MTAPGESEWATRIKRIGGPREGKQRRWCHRSQEKRAVQGGASEQWC